MNIQLIIALGGEALKALTGKEDVIKNIGKFFTYKNGS